MSVNIQGVPGGQVKIQMIYGIILRQKCFLCIITVIVMCSHSTTPLVITESLSCLEVIDLRVTNCSFTKMVELVKKASEKEVELCGLGDIHSCQPYRLAPPTNSVSQECLWDL